MLLVGASTVAPIPVAQGALHPVQALLVQVNGARSEVGLGPLDMDVRLMRVAQVQSGALAARGRLSHDVGGSLDQRVSRLGFRYWMIAENLAAGIADPARVVDSWLHSNGHRRNLLQPGAKVAGIGYVPRGKRYGHYWTLILADPAQ
jgi:uncharacterized protein YkwD